MYAIKILGVGAVFKLCFVLLSGLCLSYKTEQKNYNYKNVYSTEGSQHLLGKRFCDKFCLDFNMTVEFLL